MKSKIFCLLAILLFTTTAFTQTKEKLDAAILNNKVAFLVITDGNAKLTEAKEIASQAQKKYPKSEVITLDRLDQTNAALITKYGLSGAPTPIILVMASNGVVTSGYVLDQASPDKLVDAIPTKNQAEALLAFSDGKPAFIVLHKKSMIDKTAVLEECKKASTALNEKAVIVEVDLEDKSEAEFLNLLKPEMNATITHVLVFNAKGQFTGEFKAPVNASDIITASRKIISSSCAPGAGSGCCPK